MEKTITITIQIKNMQPEKETLIQRMVSSENSKKKIYIIIGVFLFILILWFDYKFCIMKHLAFFLLFSISIFNLFVCSFMESNRFTISSCVSRDGNGILIDSRFVFDMFFIPTPV